MRKVEYFTFILPPDPWRKKPHHSSWKLTREDAAARYPGAVAVEASREVRLMPETEEEIWRGGTGPANLLVPKGEKRDN